MHKDITAYNKKQTSPWKEICEVLAKEIDAGLPQADSKVWHAHPVWFLVGNPVAGYRKLKDSVQLLFWNGQSFDEPDLQKEGSFNVAQAGYTDVSQINVEDLHRWLQKAIGIQWDYKNIVKRKGELIKITKF